MCRPPGFALCRNPEHGLYDQGIIDTDSGFFQPPNEQSRKDDTNGFPEELPQHCPVVRQLPMMHETMLEHDIQFKRLLDVTPVW